MVASKSKSDLPKNAAQGKRFAIVASRYHPEITRELLEGATRTLEGLGAKSADIITVWVPGSFEIPQTAHVVAQYQKVDAIICLGVLIKGETTHDQVIAREVARGVSQVGHASGIPISFGVLTTETLEQAQARAGGAKGNKGAEAAETAVAMIKVFEDLKNVKKPSSGTIGFGVV
jgi:6,7-dimethyl-8-ribityllumazine synthase